MKEYELSSFLISDYIYIPYINKEDITLKNNGEVFKNDFLCKYKNKEIYSPVSGKAYGLSEINSLDGMKKVLIIENDFKDKVEKKSVVVKDIYTLNKEDIIKHIEDVIKCASLTLKLEFNNKYDLKAGKLLSDYINDILETLNIIDNNSEVPVKILLNKKDLISYQNIFLNIGTYPNIEVKIGKVDKMSKFISVYDVIDIYNDIKNRTKRDFIYLTVINSLEVKVFKVKRYSNLKDLLVHLNTMSTNITINNKIKLTNANFLLDDNVYLVNIG